MVEFRSKFVKREGHVSPSLQWTHEAYSPLTASHQFLSNLLSANDTSSLRDLLSSYCSAALRSSASRGFVLKRMAWRQFKRTLRRAVIAADAALYRRHTRFSAHWDSKMAKSIDLRQPSYVRSSIVRSFARARGCCLPQGLACLQRGLGPTAELREHALTRDEDGEVEWPLEQEVLLSTRESLTDLVTNDVENEHASDNWRNLFGNNTFQSFSAKSFNARAYNTAQAEFAE